MFDGQSQKFPTGMKFNWLSIRTNLSILLSWVFGNVKNDRNKKLNFRSYEFLKIWAQHRERCASAELSEFDMWILDQYENSGRRVYSHPEPLADQPWKVRRCHRATDIPILEISYLEKIWS